MAKQLISERELCTILGMSRWGVAACRDRGMPHLKLGRSYRYDLEKVLRWAERNAERGSIARQR